MKFLEICESHIALKFLESVEIMMSDPHDHRIDSKALVGNLDILGGELANTDFCILSCKKKSGSTSMMHDPGEISTNHNSQYFSTWVDLVLIIANTSVIANDSEAIYTLVIASDREAIHPTVIASVTKQSIAMKHSKTLHGSLRRLTPRDDELSLRTKGNNPSYCHCECNEAVHSE